MCLRHGSSCVINGSKSWWQDNIGTSGLAFLCRRTLMTNTWMTMTSSPSWSPIDGHVLGVYMLLIAMLSHDVAICQKMIFLFGTFNSYFKHFRCYRSRKSVFFLPLLAVFSSLLSFGKLSNPQKILSWSEYPPPLLGQYFLFICYNHCSLTLKCFKWIMWTVEELLYRRLLFILSKWSNFVTYFQIFVSLLDLTMIRVAQENLPHYFSCLANFACNQDAHLLDIPGRQSTRRNHAECSVWPIGQEN